MALGGAINIGDTASVCDDTINGSMRFNATTGLLELCTDDEMGAGGTTYIDTSANPQTKTGGLSVGSLVSSGAVMVGNTSNTCESGLDGALRFNTTTKEIETCSDKSGSYA